MLYLTKLLSIKTQLQNCSCSYVRLWIEFGNFAMILPYTFVYFFFLLFLYFLFICLSCYILWFWEWNLRTSEASTPAEFKTFETFSLFSSPLSSFPFALNPPKKKITKLDSEMLKNVQCYNSISYTGPQH